MTEALIEHVAQAIVASAHLSSCDLVPRDNAVDRDRALLEILIGGGLASGFVRIWRQRRCIVVPAYFTRRSGFGDATRRSADRGWPVRLRISGGSAVAQHPGILNLSLFRCGDSDMEASYAALLSVLASAMGELGLSVDAGPVAEAYCDGRFNLRWRGRKLAGTAAALRMRGGQHFALIHANLAVDAELADDLTAIAALEAGLGMDKSYQIEAHASVRAALDAPD